MRRLNVLLALVVLGIMLIPPLTASANEFSSIQSISATIPTITTLDANAGAEGLGLTSSSAAYVNDGAISATAGFVINTSDTHFYLRAKGSRNYVGVLPASASALMVNSYVELSMSSFDVTANYTTTATLAGATGTCTWHPLRC